MSPNLLTKPAPAFRQNSRLACVGALALVFLCGAAAGALAMNLGHKSLHKTPFWTEAGKAIYLDKVTKELDLTPAQTGQMESILDDFAKYYRTVLSDGKSRMMQILNEEQRRKFELMLQTQR